jgi:hypothetical protein
VDYPVTVSIEYPEKLSRLSTFFRIFMVIPQWIVLYFLGMAVSIVIIIAWFAILFTGNYPRWAFFFVSGFVRWYARVRSYYCLLTDKYPPFKLT